MNPSQIALVQSSFDLVLPIANDAASAFYSRLFKLDPSLRPLFTGDMRQQGRKLMDMIAAVVRSLDKLDRIIPSVRALGQRHVAYAVRDEHYETFGAALLWTLEQGLGDAWTVELATAWATAYTMLAATMKDAASKMTFAAV